MAKIEGNALGGFRGKLGNLVGYSWKGLWCVRVRPAVVRNPRSEAQQRHRAMFAEEVRLAGRMSWALNIGLAAVADELHMTPCNAFVKANQQAFSTSGNGLAVNWSGLIVSAGPVAPIELGTPEVSDEGVLEVAFEKNPYHLRADGFDEVHLYVYCPAASQGYLAAPVYRKERRIKVSLPDDMIGQELHLYAFVTNDKGQSSDTSYASPEMQESGERRVESGERCAVDSADNGEQYAVGPTANGEPADAPANSQLSTLNAPHSTAQECVQLSLFPPS